MNTLNIAYTLSNENYKSVIVSIKSLVENCVNSYICLFLIIDEQFKYSKEILNNIKSHKLEINWYKVNSGFYKRSLYTRFIERFYFYEFCKNFEGDRILYIHCDSLVLGDLSELYSIDLDGNSCGAVEYIHADTTRNLCGEIKCKLPVVLTTFLVDVKKWNEKGNSDKKLAMRDIIMYNLSKKCYNYTYI